MSGIGAGPSLDAKKEKVLEYLSEGMTTAQMLHSFDPPLKESTFRALRKADPDFDRACRDIFEFTRGASLETRSERRVNTTFDPDRPLPPDLPFAEWRRKYIGRPTEPLHEAIAEAAEDSTSNRIVILAPPGGGKDTTVGDIVLKIKSRDRKYLRVAWIMETEPMSKNRVSERIAPYFSDPSVYDAAPPLTPGGSKPTGSLIEDFGPFQYAKGMKWPDGTPVIRRTWNKNQMRFLQTSRAPEADPDLWATGMNSALYGSRVGLMIWSDLFTTENQASPTEKAAQWKWLNPTALSRLDSTGRLLVIGTRVAPDDNYQRLIDFLVPEVLDIPIRSIERKGGTKPGEGPIEVVKYRNGVTIIRCQAIWADDQGVEHSYSPNRFPLDDMWQNESTGEMWPYDDFDEDYAQAKGWVRAKGLRTIRAEDPDVFECSYQQNPRVDAESADFKPELLDQCMNAGRERAFGTYMPHEMLVQTIDPARSQGAAYAILAADFETRKITVVDAWWGRKLGIQGIKSRLVSGPAMRWHPDWVVYEGNHEQGIMFDSEIVAEFRRIGAQTEIVHTGDKRSDPIVGIASVSKEMRQGRFVLPSAGPADVVASRRIKQHFINWDKNPKRTRTQKPLEDPDDLAMCIAIGILFIRKQFERMDRRERERDERDGGTRDESMRRHGVPAIVRDRYAARAGRREKRQKPRNNPVTGAGLMDLLTGNYEG